jgi:hypothetical protein
VAGTDPPGRLACSITRFWRRGFTSAGGKVVTWPRGLGIVSRYLMADRGQDGKDGPPEPMEQGMP